MKKPKQASVLIVASGSGGHIYPALALAQLLLARGVRVHWIGSKDGLEKKILHNHSNITHHAIYMPRMRGKGIVRWLLLPYVLAYAVFQSMRILQRTQTHCVMCFGGFVTVPAGLAAWGYSVPLCIHEQNAIAGLSNRVLMRIADCVFSNFTQTKYMPQATAIGNPVRESIRTITPVQERFCQRTGVIRMAIIGGSQGALALNTHLPPLLSCVKQPLSVWHQSGKTPVAPYTGETIESRIDAFIDDMSQVYAWADLVIARAGATTISELISCGVAAILIPFPHAVDDHQNANADALVATGGAYKVTQNTIDTIPAYLCTLLAGSQQQVRQRLASMAHKTQTLQNNNQDAAIVLADKCAHFYQIQQAA